MVAILIALICVVLLLAGLLGGVFLLLAAAVGAAIWLLAPVVAIVVLGLVSLVLSPILKAMAPDVWEIVNRRQLEERRRREFFDDLRRASAPHIDARPRQRGDRRGQVYDLTPQLGSLSGPQVRPFEHRAKLPDPLAK